VKFSNPGAEDKVMRKANLLIQLVVILGVGWFGLTTANAQCELIPQPGDIPEPEFCGDDTNGGCNSVPPAFTPAACGDTFFGSVWAEDGTRDTDWFMFYHSGGEVSFTLAAELPSLNFYVQILDVCTPVVIEPIGYSDSCVETSVTADLAPGEYVAFVATGNPDGTGIFDGYPCSEFNDYRLTIECGIEVDIDIKPGSYPNSINVKSNGVVPVAILGSDVFDVTSVDVTTLAFGPAGASPVHDLTNADTYFYHLQDVNGDGWLDLVAHFRQKEAGLMKGDTEATLTGATWGGIPFEGTDSVNTSPGN
jgi:hypothetical protein